VTQDATPLLFVRHDQIGASASSTRSPGALREIDEAGISGRSDRTAGAVTCRALDPDP
jgi:hypothetical protein